jgi:adenylylsulfate kinase-like enzyme
VYRAALGKADFSVFLTGLSGAFKTALAALCQQHFGAVLDASRLPAATVRAMTDSNAAAQDSRERLLCYTAAHTGYSPCNRPTQRMS